MRYELTAVAFDMLDMVHISAGVRDTTKDPTDPDYRLVRITRDIAGTGESDPEAWLRDVLVALLEHL